MQVVDGPGGQSGQINEQPSVLQPAVSGEWKPFRVVPDAGAQV